MLWQWQCHHQQLQWAYRACFRPWPLPILGVGAAFAYSRRLRRRINLAKSPVSTDSVVAEQL